MEGNTIAPIAAAPPSVPAADLGLPMIELRYENISYNVAITKAEANETTPSVPAAVAKFVALPLRIPWMIAKKLLPSREQTSAPRIRTVLQNVSGVIRPGTLTLVLSPPGHSKSAFLKAITMQLPGQTKSHKFHNEAGKAPYLPPNKPGVCGNISYSGATISNPRGCHLGQLVQYVSQLDEHLPHLTVRETLSFVYQNAVVDPATCGHPELAAEHTRGVDSIIEFLHLENCQNTIIGNDLMRGVSGGEKKRVTVAEGLATNARLLALDEISTGLDSAVTYKIVKSLRDKSQANGMSAVISLLQATPEVYGLFDEVVLLREGCIVYHGPTDRLPGYLKGLGYAPPVSIDAGAVLTHSNPAHHHVDRDMADWLVEFLTDPVAVLKKRPSADATPENCPTSTEQLNASWNASEIHQQQMGAPPSAKPLELTSDFAKAQYGHAYAHSFAAHLYYLLIRQFVLMRRNPLYLRARIGSALIMGFILGGLYYQRTIDEGMTYYGTFLNACMNMGFANLAEMATSVEQKYIAYKHISHGNYPTTAFVLAGAVAHIPVSILVCFIYLGILYGMVGLSAGADHFFFFMLICFLVDIFFRNMMALFSYAGRSLQAAQAAPLPVISLLILFAGFLVAPAKMGWLTFMYYVDIMGYAIRSLAMNEFYSSRYDVHPGNSPHSLGYLYLDAFGIPTDPAWKWGGVAFEAGACIVIIIASYFAFASIRFDRNIGSRRDAKAILPPDSAVVDVASPKLSVTTPTSPVRGAWDSTEERTGPSPPTSSASGMPFERMSVVFKDMKYTVQLPKRAGGGSRILLRGINGYAKPGRMTALMGASGAGKTTLLDVLAGRKNQGVLEGEILLNGFAKEEKTFNRVTAYVEQSDVHLPLTTVREAVEFSAALRLPPSVPEKDRAAFVEEVLALLELTSLQHRLVGIAGAANSLAPGERKRLTIAVELVSNAPVIFLDEPTSGLDSRAAEIVMRVIRNIANTGRTIICTIHQPSSDLFFMFDDLILLQRGGWQVYLGPLGRKGSELIKYLEGVPNFGRCPRGLNPSSWMLDVLGSLPSTTSTSVKDGASPVDGSILQEVLQRSPQWAAAQASMVEAQDKLGKSAPLSFTSRRARSIGAQYLILVRRLAKMYYRNVGLNYGRYLALTLLNLMFGTVYFKIADSANDLAGVQSLVAAIFMTAAFAAMINMNVSVPPALQQRPVLYRELSSYMYDPTVHNLSTMTVEFPTLAIIIISTLPIVYFMLGLSTSPATFFFHTFAVYILGCVYVSIGQALAASMPTFEVAQAFLGILGPLFFLFGGLWSPPSQMAPGARWFCWIDPITYAFRAIIAPHFYCEGAGCPSVAVFSTGGVHIIDRYTYVSDKYDVHFEDRWDSVGYLFIFVCVFQVLSILATRYIRHIAR